MVAILLAYEMFLIYYFVLRRNFKHNFTQNRREFWKEAMLFGYKNFGKFA